MYSSYLHTLEDKQHTATFTRSNIAAGTRSWYLISEIPFSLATFGSWAMPSVEYIEIPYAVSFQREREREREIPSAHNYYKYPKSRVT